MKLSLALVAALVLAMAPVAMGAILFNEGFDNYHTGSRPAGWIFSGCDQDTDTYTIAGYYGALTPSIRLENGDSITTETFASGANLQFWLRGTGTQVTSHLMVEEYYSLAWHTVVDINPLPSPGVTQGPYALNASSTLIHFEYFQEPGEGYAGVDDVRVDDAGPTPPTPPPTPPTPPPTPPTPPPTPPPTVPPTPPPTPISGPTPWKLVLDADDFNGDGTGDLGLWRAGDGSWRVRDISNVYYGISGDIPVTGDYNGDGTAEYCVWRPLNAKWCWRGMPPNVYYGISTDVPVPADYSGDGATDTAVWRPAIGAWYVRGLTRIYYGVSGDQPIAADYNGDGTAETATYRFFSGGAAWYVRAFTRSFYGLEGDIPTPGDFNGDGATQFSVFRPYYGRWYTQGEAYLNFGQAGDIPVIFDYNGDGTADRALFRPSSGNWYIYGVTSINYGLSGDQPAVGVTY